MSIATQTGDSGHTSLVGGDRVSKAGLRVEALGSVDELNASLGLARSLCREPKIATATESIQRTLFRIGSALATPQRPAEKPPEVAASDVEALTALVHSYEARPGMLSDWSLPGSEPSASAYDVARTVCRRAERAVVRLSEEEGPVDAPVLAWLNRLSDLLWLFGRALELAHGADSGLRDESDKGPRWSRAW